MMASAVAVLPLPDSPATPTIRPGDSARLRTRTARVRASPLRYSTPRSSTTRSGRPGAARADRSGAPFRPTPTVVPCRRLGTGGSSRVVQALPVAEGEGADDPALDVLLVHVGGGGGVDHRVAGAGLHHAVDVVEELVVVRRRVRREELVDV